MKNPIRFAAAAAALAVMPALAHAETAALALEPFAEALDTCTPAEGQLPGAVSDNHAILGADAEGCRYVRQGMDGIDMACAFSSQGRAAYAESLRAIAGGDDGFERHEAWDRECVYVLTNGEHFPVAGPAPAATFAPMDDLAALVAMADALEACTPAVAETPSPSHTALAVVRTVIDAGDGTCTYVQTKPFGTMFECALSPTGRQALAADLRVQARDPESLETPEGLDVYGPECELVMFDGSRMALAL